MRIYRIAQVLQTFCRPGVLNEKTVLSPNTHTETSNTPSCYLCYPLLGSSNCCLAPFLIQNLVDLMQHLDGKQLIRLSYLPNSEMNAPDEA
jgi:hypothetical protein